MENNQGVEVQNIEESNYSNNHTSKPRVGMEFPDNEVAYKFYKFFALKQGFAIIKY